MRTAQAVYWSRSKRDRWLTQGLPGKLHLIKKLYLAVVINISHVQTSAPFRARSRAERFRAMLNYV